VNGALSAMSSACPVCDGSGLLLTDSCPLCCDQDGDADDSTSSNSSCSIGGSHEAAGLAPGSVNHWCDVCGLDLQSSAAMAEHVQGRRHLKHVAGSTATKRLQRTQEQPTLTEESFFAKLAGGAFKHIVVLTGAGVSTAAGIPDFRSPGGMFHQIRCTWGSRFPQLLHSPEMLLSRHFARSQGQIYENEVQPWLRSLKWNSAEPTAVHKFCAWLQRQGWLQRVYTQNVDGLHLHADLDLPDDFVVEVHGALRNDSVVLYGDDIPRRFNTCCRQDFPKQPSESGVDLLMVFGSSLQVAPFCALPNMAPRGCTRVLVNMDLWACMVNDWSPCHRAGPYADCAFGGLAQTPGLARLAGRDVQLRPLWRDLTAKKRWPQLLVEGDCDAFVHRFFNSPTAAASNLSHSHEQSV